MRVYSGTLRAGSYVLNTSRDRRERVGRVLKMHANRPEQCDELEAGEIGALVGVSHTLTGDTLCDPEHPVKLEAIEFPAPVLSVRIHPASRSEEDKLSMALSKLAEEDPTFIVNVDDETKETIISVMGELHVEVLVERIRREQGVVCEVGRPQVAYRETATAEAEIDQRHVKQTGGRGEFARVCLELEPTPPGTGFEFVNSVKGGNVPREFVPSVEKGVIAVMARGVFACFPIVDVRVTLVDGDFHEVDSSERAFFTCASAAMREMFRRAAPTLLEPVMELNVVVPQEFLGAITGDLARRRGRIEGMEARPSGHEIDAKLPLGEAFGYATQLRNLTKGVGSFSLTFDHYEPVPFELAEKIVAGRTRRG